MKKMSKFLLAGLVLAFGATTATGAVMANNNKNTQPETVLVNNLNTYTVGQTKFAGSVTTGGINFSSMITKGIQNGGGKLIGYALKSVSLVAFKAVMKSMGFDVRSKEQKSLDNIERELDTLQKNLTQGISDIKRTFVHIHNDDIMNGLLTVIGMCKTPVAGKMATMLDIARKEIDKNYDKAELKKEKNTFYKGLGDLNFTQLGGNKLWNQVQTLADTIMSPRVSNNKITLETLYEETYGNAETWDYMMVAPRRKFIGYVGSIVNSLATLASLKATYDMSQYKDGDSNIIDIETNVNAMIDSVNALNAKFKVELDKLSAIEKKHDEDHLITHRDLVVNADGSITYKEGRTVSTKLMAVTTEDNDDNYLSYTHDQKNMSKVINTGMGTKTYLWNNFIYTLDCTSNKDLYKTVFDEYKTYKGALEVAKDFSVKDYLKAVGFTCDNKDGFEKAKGFYSRIDNRYRDDGGWFTTTKHSDLRAYYYDFNKTDKFEETPGEISEVISKTGFLSSAKYSHQRGDQMGNYYLTFVEPDQQTISGKIARTDIENVLSDTGKGSYYNNHFKGHKKWTGTEKDPVKI